MKRVRFEQDGVHVRIKCPKWWMDARSNPYGVCNTKDCYRFIDLPCRSCKFSGRPYVFPINKDLFVQILLVLMRCGLPKDLATWFVKNYIVLKTTLELRCPYFLIDGSVYHAHCREEVEEQCDAVHREAKAEISLFEQ